MNSFPAAAFAFASLLFGAPTFHLAAAATPPTAFDIPAIDAYLQQRVQNAAPVGLSVAIVKDGQVVLLKGYGYRTLTNREPVQTDTRFAIASVSKQFTCALILLLAEDGLLSIHDKVAAYYPHLSRAEDVTLLDLMNHTSGYPDYYPLDYVDRRMRRAIQPDDLLEQYAGGKLDFEPGSQYSYSNTGYILLGRIAESVTGRPLGQLIAQRLLQPLQLTRTVYEPAPEFDPDGRASGYIAFALGGPEPNTPEATGWVGAAGGLWSTPADLARWNLALVSGQVLKPESYQAMIEPRTLTTGKLSNYGCGLSVRVQNQRLVLSHSGAVSGYNTFNAVIPSTRSSLTLVCNQDGGLGNLPAELLELLSQDAGAPPAVPAVHGPGVRDVVARLVAQWQEGSIDRTLFSPDFNDYLTDERLQGASRRLQPYGTPDSVEVIRTNERGGMEVSVARLRFKSGDLRTLMYRRPNGVIEQFFISKDE